MSRRWATALAAVLLVSTGCTAESSDPDSGKEATAKKTDEVVEAVADTEPVVEKTTVRKREAVRFRTVTRGSASLDKGVTEVAARGRAGVRVKIYRVTTTDGVRTRKLVRTQVVRKPTTRVVLKGTHVDAPARPSCDSNYAGGCVPIASDVDCGGGSGDGPAYVYGTVHVVGSDVYDLDRDGDGYACD